MREREVDLIVLLAALHKNDARSIVRQVPEIDYVLGSYGGMVAAGEGEGRSSILYCGNKGQRIGESRIFLARGEETSIANRIDRLHTLSRSYPPDRGMLEFVERLRATPPGSASATAASAPVPSRAGD